MKTARQSYQNHWRSVGRRAENMGIPLDQVITKSESINALIREGYEQGQKKRGRNRPAQAVAAIAAPRVA